MYDGRPSYVIQSVSRALRMIDELGRSPRGVTAQHLARRCELPLGTTYHFLRTLCYEGYAVHRPGGRYVLGFKVVERFGDFLAVLERPPAVHDVLRHLGERTGHSIYWGQVVDGRIVITDLFEGPKSPHVEDLMVGFDVAAHATALGKALLSSLPATERQSYLREQGLRPFTHNTVLDPQAINYELRTSAKNGTFTDLTEYRDNVCCAAVLVPSQHTKAAIGVCGDPDRWQRLGPHLIHQLRISASDLHIAERPASGSGS